MRGIATKKNEVVGNFKSGTSYSSKFSFLEHLNEETIIRLDNKQNLFFVFFWFFHYITSKISKNQRKK